ncbi:MAG: thiolase C-terminal domain-containing protein, partial [Pseudomonadota bacterium]
MACEAIRKAMADAGLKPSDIDGMTSYQVGDSTTTAHVATALGMRLNYAVDILGGGSSTEVLVAHAVGLIEGGYCKTIVIFRSMNGRSGRRMGGQVPGGPIPVALAEGDGQFNMGWGWTTPAQRFGMSAMRYLRDTGCTTKAFAEIAVAHRLHASLNPKALHRSP